MKYDLIFLHLLTFSLLLRLLIFRKPRCMRDEDTTKEGSASSHHGDSILSIFESDREGSTSSSFDNASEGNASEELRVCSRCSKHLPNLEFLGGHLKIKECVALPS